MNTFDLFCSEYSYKELRGISNLYYDRFKDTLSPLIDREDYFQHMSIELFNDSNFNEDKANIRTYVNIKFKYSTLTLIRNLNAKKRLLNYNTISIDTPVNEEDGIFILDMIEDNNTNGDNIDDLYFNDCLEKICALINKEEQKIIFKMHVQGYSFIEIGKKLNLTNKQVNSSFQTVKKRLQRMDYAVHKILK